MTEPADHLISRKIVIDMCMDSTQLGRSGMVRERSLTCGDPNIKFGVVSVFDQGRMLLLDFDAAYAVFDPIFGEKIMRGFTMDHTGLEHKIEITCEHGFSSNAETGTLKHIFDWIQEQGRGQWGFEHSREFKVGGAAHKFTFFFEDAMTAVWSRMNYEDN